MSGCLLLTACALHPHYGGNEMRMHVIALATLFPVACSQGTAYVPDPTEMPLTASVALRLQRDAIGWSVEFASSDAVSRFEFCAESPQALMSLALQERDRDGGLRILAVVVATPNFCLTQEHGALEDIVLLPDMLYRLVIIGDMTEDPLVSVATTAPLTLLI